VNLLLVDLKKVCVSVRREVFCNIPIAFDIPMKHVRLIKMCLNETYSRVWVGKHLYDIFPVKHGWKQRDVLSKLRFDFALVCAVKRVHVNQDGL
jgi:hypothetical protein